ncbi:hypothetical protein PBAC_28460 [Pedobacter glucosidilyticus]|uniref:Uncharacterized protein n=1 Tax=Pedobacter aquae TaxID=2605747 RepID=A0A5C0VC79_9SPHI|nr:MULTISPECIES: hypothetical protein [Pedobacter]KHJ37001.1 hypothetical protein PBAC_28460 [Pedobacter glucosidilyticus]QEK50368.1 hypothetical protein FYC62_00800 [Pedobacter aquae]
MKGFSQKPTNCKPSNVSPRNKQFSHPKSSSWAKKEISTSRFKGMSEDLEIVPPLHIPGYKSRG